MTLNIDRIISFMEKFIGSSTDELKEQEAAASGAPSGGSASSTAPAGKPVKKWESGRTFGKTYMNDPKYGWKSDRVIGKTGGSDFA